METLARCHQLPTCSAYLLMTPVSGITLVAIGEDSVCPDTTVEPLTSIIGFCSDLIPSVLDRQKGGKSLGHRESVSYKTRSADGQTVWLTWTGVAPDGPVGRNTIRQCTSPALLLLAQLLLPATCHHRSLACAASMSQLEDVNSMRVKPRPQPQLYMMMPVFLGL